MMMMRVSFTLLNQYQMLELLESDAKKNDSNSIIEPAYLVVIQ